MDYLTSLLGYLGIVVVLAVAWLFFCDAISASSDLKSAGIVTFILIQACVSGIRKHFNTSFFGAYTFIFKTGFMWLRSRRGSDEG